MGEPLRVVIADDSSFVCRLLNSYLNAVPGIEVAGTALNGARAVDLVRELAPDVATLDLDMPVMDGLEALDLIMHETPTPVVMISGVSGKAADRTLKALNLGAVDFVLKYSPGADVDPQTLQAEIIAKVRAAARVRVVRSVRRRAGRGPWPVPAPAPREGQRPEAAARLRPGTQLLAGGVVVVGASTGGPVALKELLSALPADLPAAVLVVQHMPPSFTRVLAAQLDRQVPLAVREAAEGDRLQAGTALVAPGGYHLLLSPDSRVRLQRGPEICGHRPSIDVTMQAVAQLYGSRTRGVVLTGMGSDGADGLVAVRARGGKTFAQDPATCVVSGMPQRAMDRKVVDCVASPREIAHLLSLEHGSAARQEAC